VSVTLFPGDLRRPVAAQPASQGEASFHRRRGVTMNHDDSLTNRQSEWQARKSENSTEQATE